MYANAWEDFDEGVGEGLDYAVGFGEVGAWVGVS